MRKILLVWDVKSRGSPATLFYRALCGYDYETKSGRNHSPGILDEIPEDVWEFINRSTLLIEEEYAKMVERIFKEFAEHLVWYKFVVEEE
ncbi:MAG: hypothetical protein QW835_04080 [Candidatus Hadarchaeum sp.]|uniref:hypothetical protein n=1 Tax=Candidatus Hadarchaeum sp. TaxID=2883567 RepID=UPI003172C529